MNTETVSPVVAVVVAVVGCGAVAILAGLGDHAPLNSGAIWYWGTGTG